MKPETLSKFKDENLTMSILLNPQSYENLVKGHKELILDRSPHWEYLKKFIPSGPTPVDLFGNPLEVYPGLIGIARITVTFHDHTQKYIWGISKVIMGEEYWYIILKSEIKLGWL